MATILDKITFDPCQRPAYTAYEISKMVAKRRSDLGFSIDEFSKKYNVPSQLINSIEQADQLFNVPMYKASSVLLGLPLEELLKVDREEVNCVKCRTDEISDDVMETITLANVIFNEAVMQQKISAR